MTDWVGQTFGSYQVLALLGEGAMGPVYKARDTRLERFVALRLPPAHLVGDAHFLADFRREAAAATKFAHKNLVQVYDIGEYHRMPYVVLELIDGESLAARLARKGSLPTPDALATLLYVAKALGAAWHESRILHLSLKPSSLLVARDGEVKLSDLGRARHAQLAGEAISPPDEASAPYASPELLRGEAQLDLRADIYSLGCILYQSITGRLHMLGTPLQPELLPADSSPALAKLLASMLAVDPAQRPSSYDELLMDIWRLDQQQLAVTAPPALPPPPPVRVRRRIHWSRYAIGAVVLVVVGCWLTWAVQKVRQIIAQNMQPPELSMAEPAPSKVPKPQPKAPPKPVVKAEPSATASIRPALVRKAWKAPVDLLAMVEPKRDTVGGHWQREEGALVGSLGGKQRLARLEFAYEPPAEYDMRVEFTPQEVAGGGLHLTAFSRDFAWNHFMGAKGRACGFELVSDRPLVQNVTCVMLAPMEKGRRYSALVEVRRNGVRGFIDDQFVTERKTDFRDMDEPPYWKLHAEGRLGLGCAGRTLFHTVELREVSGRGRSTLAEADAPRSPADKFVAEVAALPVADQLKRVVEELQKLNPGFDGKVAHEIENGKVVMLALDSTAVTKLEPVRALTALQSFQFGSGEDLAGPRYPLSDLQPLQGLPLVSVICNNTEVSTLAPLNGMALTTLKCAGSPVTDLLPLRGMQLLECDCRKTAVTDLGPLRKMPLRYLFCDVAVATNGPNRGVIRSLDTTIREVNGCAPDAFWKQPRDYTPPTGKPLIRRD